MVDLNRNLLSNLILISKVDASLALNLAEKRRLEMELLRRLEELKRSEHEIKAKDRVLEEKRTRYNREEKRSREEAQKLVDRRKALQTLANYKHQQAAEREIEHAARQLNTHEESLLNALQEIDTLAADLAKIKESFSAKEQEGAKFQDEAKATLVALEERRQTLILEREVLVTQIDAASLTSYNRIRERYPQNAVVRIVSGNCSGCFMSLGPQVPVQISRGTALVRCPGCGRILYLEESKEE